MQSTKRAELSDGGNLIALLGVVAGVIAGVVAASPWWGLLAYLVAAGLARHVDWLLGHQQPAGASSPVAGGISLPDDLAEVLDSTASGGTVPIRSRTLRFSYEDSRGDESTREVDVSLISAQRFTGWCHLRAERRTFRWDRVVGDLLDLQTGELYKPRKAYSELRAQHAA